MTDVILIFGLLCYSLDLARSAVYSKYHGYCLGIAVYTVLITMYADVRFTVLVQTTEYSI